MLFPIQYFIFLLPLLCASAPRHLPPPRAPALRTAALGADVPLSVHALTIPAYGHYQTTKGILLALAARGHNVTLLGCESTGKDVRDDGLEGPLGVHGGAIHFVSLGVCPSYTRREGALAQLVAGSPMPALEGIRELSQDMCTAAMEYYRGDPQGRLPRVLVFDADTYCAMDLSVAWRVPRVARVGTGPRDAYTTSIHIPMFSSGLPLHMTLPQRLANWATRALSRHVIGPLLLPWLYSGHRAAWAASVEEGRGGGGHQEHQEHLQKVEGEEGGGGRGAASKEEGGPSLLPPLILPAGGGYTHNESTMPPDLPWDGVPTLFNTHWGLEHARPLAPYEHLIGHTNDFEGDAGKALPPGVGEWIAAAGAGAGTAAGGGGAAAAAAPVVYVGMGTLSILPPPTLAAFAAALTQCPGARFIWSVPASQHAFLPPLLRLSSLRSLCAFGGGEEACQEAARQGVVMMGDSDRGEGVRPGSVLLLPWAPQLAVLVEEGVRVFATHGGMNGIAEGLYARTPLLCIPLFSDQPDNCARAKDKGYAQVLHLSPTLTPGDLWGALRPLLDPINTAPLAQALQEAWVRNVGAGGAHRAVGVIEECAALPYGSHLAATVPREYFMPWYQRWGVDIGGVVGVGLGLGVWTCRLGCRACVYVCRVCRVCGGGGGGRGVRTRSSMSEAKVVAAAAAAVARIKFKGRKIVNTFIQSV